MRTGNLTEIIWIDYTKCICLFFVYIAHASFYSGVSLPNFLLFFQPFYVNAFFIISGYLFFRKQFSPPVKDLSRRSWFLFKNGCGKLLFENVIFRIVIPSIIFSALFYLPKILLRDVSFSSVELFRTTIGGKGFWYTSSLAVAQTVLILLLYSRIKQVDYYLFVSVILLIIVQYCLPVTSYPWFLRTGLTAVFFLCLGGMLWKYEKRIDCFLGESGVAIVLICSLLYVYEVFVHKGLRILGGEGVVNVRGLFCSVYSSFVLILICKKITKLFDSIKFIGRNSIIFYFFSGAIPNTLSIVFNNYFKALNDNLKLIMIVLLSILIASIITKIISIHLPFLKDMREIILRKEICKCCDK